MTPTTSTSSVLLVSAAAPSAKAAVANDTDATPGAALHGFELLLGTMQELQGKLSAQLANGKAAAKNDDAASDENGNQLPLLGTMLPSLTLAPAQVADENSAKTNEGSSDENKDKTGDASGTSGIPNIAMLQPIATEHTSLSPETAAADSSDFTIDSAQSGKGKNAVNAALTQTLNSGSANANSSTATGNVAVETSAVIGKELQNTAKPNGESDFDALIKHLDTTSATQLASPTQAGDTGNLNQASRVYSNAAGSSASVAVPVGSNGWGDAIADKVMWFSANKISSAEIHLNPPDLGPLQVRVSTQHDQASVMFTSQHAAVRDALDQALPRLRDMMGNQGMHLLDVSVGGQNPQQQQQQQQFSRNGSSGDGSSFAGLFGDEPVEPSSVTTVSSVRFLRSGLDAYA